MSEKQTKSGITRRNFLRGSAAVGTGMLIVPSSYVFGGPSAPSNMITRAVIGTGGMGMGHVTKYPQTLAVCDVDKNHLENAKRKAGGQVAAYSDWREVFSLNVFFTQDSSLMTFVSIKQPPQPPEPFASFAINALFHH